VSPLAGTVARLHVREGQQVARGELLAEVSA
jgi:multidrug efflux pump subunit AcrA (membrane-fusion protein)